MSSFKFDLGYQRSILSLMLQDYLFLGLSAQYLEPKLFDSEVLAWFFIIIRDYYMDYRARPTKKYMKRQLIKALRKGKIKSKKSINEAKTLYGKLWKSVKDADYLIDEVRQFVRHQAIKNAMLHTVSLLEQERYDDVEEVMQEAFRAGLAGIDIGTEYFTDFRERIVNRRRERLTVSTGIPELDKHLSFGGLNEKEMGMVLAPPSIGKSMCLLHIAKAALVRKHKVALYTLEMSEDAYAERFDSSWSGVNMQQDNPALGRVFKRINAMKSQYGSPLVIKEFPTSTATVNTIRSHLDHLESMLDFVPDLIIVDYAELMQAVNKRNEHRLAIGEVVKELRGLAVERGVPLWSAAQANRKALSKKTITIEDLSESFESAKHADVIIALCQTKEEKKEEMMRIFLAKNRNFTAKITAAEFQTAFGRYQFYIRP